MVVFFNWTFRRTCTCTIIGIETQKVNHILLFSLERQSTDPVHILSRPPPALTIKTSDAHFLSTSTVSIDRTSRLAVGRTPGETAHYRSACMGTLGDGRSSCKLVWDCSCKNCMQYCHMWRRIRADTGMYCFHRPRFQQPRAPPTPSLQWTTSGTHTASTRLKASSSSRATYRRVQEAGAIATRKGA